MRHATWLILCFVCLSLFAADTHAKSYRFCGFTSKSTAIKIRCSSERVRGLNALGSFSQLRELNFTRSGLKSLRLMPTIDSLRVLSLNYTPIKSLKWLTKNPTIEELDASNTAITTLHGIQRLRHLRHLTLWNVKIESLDPIARLHRLESLVLGGTSVRDLRPIAGLKGLRLLNLERTPIRELTHLSKLEGLDTLFLAGTSLTREVLEQFRTRLPKVRIVGCDGKSATPCALVHTPLPPLCSHLIECCGEIRGVSADWAKRCELVEATVKKVARGSGDSTKLMTRICEHALREYSEAMGSDIPSACLSRP